MFPDLNLQTSYEILHCKSQSVKTCLVFHFYICYDIRKQEPFRAAIVCTTHTAANIFICNFNMFEKYGRHMYTFRHYCLQDRKIELRDGAEIIFLCTKGTIDDVTPEMQAFLKYVAQNKPEGDFAKRLEKAVGIARLNPRWRSEYMNLEEMIEERSKLMIEQITQEKDEIKRKMNKLAQEKEAADLRIAELEKRLAAYEEKGN